MKNAFFALVSIISLQSFGQDFNTQDNVNYIILMNTNLETEQRQVCIEKICRSSVETGTGECSVVFDIGNTLILSVNLSSFAAQQAKDDVACTSSVELDGEVTAHPSVGKSN